MNEPNEQQSSAISAINVATDTVDTIAAVATPPGKGGVGIIRLSGPNSVAIAEQVSHKSRFENRYATYAKFYDSNKEIIDSGLIICFQAPNSFTGEHVAEIQGHGGPVILQMLLSRVIELGARQARPGEFSERAFLNEKLDLAQAEAIADLIESSSEAAAKAAVRSLQGEFSSAIHALLADLINIRMYVESAIDFPEEEIDFLSDGIVLEKIDNVIERIEHVQKSAGAGQLLQDGFHVALAGKPNAGKSTLMNALSGYEAAIVTDIAGTTRDSINVTLDFDGLPIHITDTAGLRDSDDVVEQIGVQRAKQAIESADHVLLLVDVKNQTDLNTLLLEDGLDGVKHKITVVYTKHDTQPDFCVAEPDQESAYHSNLACLTLSALKQSGIDSLKQHIKTLAGYRSEDSNVFSARARHIEAIQTASDAVYKAKESLLEQQAGELVAFELLVAQNELNSITGEFNADDLLGEIFSSFCIGK